MVAYVGIIYNKPDGEIRSIVVPDSDEQLNAWSINDSSQAMYKMAFQTYEDCGGIDGVREAFAQIYADELGSA